MWYNKAMNENLSTTRFKREVFTNESYMNPRNDFLKYKDRAGSIGLAESKRRLNTLPLIEKKAKELAQELNVELPEILPKGSSVVNMATVDSDFDIAVIVESGHIFTKEPTLWRMFQGGMESLDFGFHIEPRLVVADDNRKPFFLDEAESGSLKCEILKKVRSKKDFL